MSNNTLQEAIAAYTSALQRVNAIRANRDALIQRIGLNMDALIKAEDEMFKARQDLDNALAALAEQGRQQ